MPDRSNYGGYGSTYGAGGGGYSGQSQSQQRPPGTATMPSSPGPTLSDQDFEGRMRARAMDMVAGKGIPTGDQIYGGMAPGISEGVSREQGGAAMDLAGRGLSRSGIQAGTVVGGVRKEANMLSDARTRSDEQARQMRDQAMAQGSEMLFRIEDRAQQDKAAEQARLALEWEKKPWWEKTWDDFYGSAEATGNRLAGR